MQGHSLKAVMRKIQHSQTRRPFRDIRDIRQPVVREVELIQARQLQQAAGDLGQFVVHQVKLDNL